LAFIVLVLNEMVLVLVLDSVFSITSTSTASLSTASLSTASLSTASLSGLLARLGLLTGHLRLVLDLGQLDPLER
jgi:chemotaxis signal transduction protein